MTWVNWMNTIPPYEVQAGGSFAELIIPIADSIRVSKVFNTLITAGRHVLLVGPTGTGKSIMISNELRNNFDNENYTNINLSFSAQTSSNQTQRIIDGNMEKKRKQVYGPAMNKTGIIFVDDLNMPEKQTWGAQPPIELLR